MRETRAAEPKGFSQATTTAFIVIALLAGFWAGYLYRGQTENAQAAARVPVAGNAPAAPNSGAAPVLAEHDLQVHLAVLQKDPKNLQALVQAGNIYYDSQRYQEAINYYTQALAVEPGNVDVRTDLGTAFWYANKPKEAVEQFDLALKARPAYPQTLFNLGIVKLHGLNDPEGAIAAWQTLLSTNPNYPDVAKVRSLMEEARSVASGAAKTGGK